MTSLASGETTFTILRNRSMAARESSGIVARYSSMLRAFSMIAPAHFRNINHQVRDPDSSSGTRGRMNDGSGRPMGWNFDDADVMDLRGITFGCGLDAISPWRRGWYRIPTKPADWSLVATSRSIRRLFFSPTLPT